MGVYLTETIEIEVELEHVIDFIEEATPKELGRIRTALGEAYNESTSGGADFGGDSIDMQMRLELLSKVAKRYTLQQLWSMFPDL
jgi:hypothetical protein